jgi:mono/diheme cytochrome c family protein
MTMRLRLGLAALICLGIVGFARYSVAADSDGAANTKVSDEARAKANEIYESRCEACHGTEGHGDGPGAMALGKKPANFTNKKWQRHVTDKQIATAIVQGGQAVGLSAEMQPNPDLASQPMVVQALVMKVRDFKK